jgi:phenylacetate-coenzyme A ligase PaaK-like adenylate-forming protein
MTTSQHRLPASGPGELTEQMRREIEDRLDLTAVDIQVVDPDTLERSVGTMRRVIDQRPR